MTPLKEVGEVSIPPTDLKDIHLPDIATKFEGFDRNPYLVAFKAGKLTFLLADVHLHRHPRSGTSTCPCATRAIPSTGR